MEKRLLALILGQLCMQTRLGIISERNRRGLTTINQLNDSLVSIYESTTATLEIATKLLEEEDEEK